MRGRGRRQVGGVQEVRGAEAAGRREECEGPCHRRAVGVGAVEVHVPEGRRHQGGRQAGPRPLQALWGGTKEEGGRAQP